MVLAASAANQYSSARLVVSCECGCLDNTHHSRTTSRSTPTTRRSPSPRTGKSLFAPMYTTGKLLRILCVAVLIVFSVAIGLWSTGNSDRWMVRIVGVLLAGSFVTAFGLLSRAVIEGADRVPWSAFLLAFLLMFSMRGLASLGDHPAPNSSRGDRLGGRTGNRRSICWNSGCNRCRVSRVWDTNRACRLPSMGDLRRGGWDCSSTSRRRCCSSRPYGGGRSTTVWGLLSGSLATFWPS